MNTIQILNALTLAVSLAARLVEVAEQLRAQFAARPEVTKEDMDEALAKLDAEIARARQLQAKGSIATFG